MAWNGPVALVMAEDAARAAKERDGVDALAVSVRMRDVDRNFRCGVDGGVTRPPGRRRCRGLSPPGRPTRPKANSSRWTGSSTGAGDGRQHRPWTVNLFRSTGETRLNLHWWRRSKFERLFFSSTGNPPLAHGHHPAGRQAQINQCAGRVR